MYKEASKTQKAQNPAMDPETVTPGNHSESEKKPVTFTAKTIKIGNDEPYPAKYKINEKEIVITITLPNGKAAILTLAENSEHYAAALFAAQEVAEGKKTRGPVPEKTFIGTKITGPEWKIEFAAERTRIIFQKVPCKAYRDAVKAAGFYWSPNDKSWNKKATFKAYRAAQALNDTLWKIREGKAIPA